MCTVEYLLCYCYIVVGFGSVFKQLDVTHDIVSISISTVLTLCNENNIIEDVCEHNVVEQIRQNGLVALPVKSYRFLDRT